MPPRMLTRRTGEPRTAVVGEDGEFAPSEVARLFGHEELDYRQFGALLRLVRPVDPERRRGRPARLTFRELGALRTAFNLAGGVDALREGRNLRVAQVARACSRLREVYGVADPLSDIRLERDGSRILAVLEGVRFEVASGQVVLELREQAAGALVEVPTARKVLRSRTSAQAAGRSTRFPRRRVRMEP